MLFESLNFIKFRNHSLQKGNHNWHVLKGLQVMCEGRFNMRLEMGILYRQ